MIFFFQLLCFYNFVVFFLLLFLLVVVVVAVELIKRSAFATFEQNSTVNARYWHTIKSQTNRSNKICIYHLNARIWNARMHIYFFLFIFVLLFPLNLYYIYMYVYTILPTWLLLPLFAMKKQLIERIKWNVHEINPIEKLR